MTISIDKELPYPLQETPPFLLSDRLRLTLVLLDLNRFDDIA